MSKFLPRTGCQAQTCSCFLVTCNKMREKTTMALLIRMMKPISSLVGVPLLGQIRWIHWPTSSMSWNIYPVCHGQALIFLPLCLNCQCLWMAVCKLCWWTMQ